MKWRKAKSGFSLLELIAVVMILGILAATAMSRVSAQALDAKKKCCRQYKADLNAAIERYYFEQGAYPAQLSDLEGDIYTEAIPKCPVDNSPYAVEATLHRITGHNH